MQSDAHIPCRHCRIFWRPGRGLLRSGRRISPSQGNIGKHRAVSAVTDPARRNPAALPGGVVHAHGRQPARPEHASPQSENVNRSRNMPSNRSRIPGRSYWPARRNNRLRPAHAPDHAIHAFHALPRWARLKAPMTMLPAATQRALSGQALTPFHHAPQGRSGKGTTILQLPELRRAVS